MTIHTAAVFWERHAHAFTDQRYSRVHRWQFDGGAIVPASSSPHIVPVPQSNPACVDPEEAFIAALSSCHMLWFLGLAARDGYVVDSYADAVHGEMARNAQGQEAITCVTLRPVVIFSGSKIPDDASLDRLHHAAHTRCFLANSVKTLILIEGSWQHAE